MRLSFWPSSPGRREHAAAYRPRACGPAPVRFGVLRGWEFVPPSRRATERGGQMGNGNGGIAGIGLGGVLVIAGIVIAVVWSVWLGVILAIVGLVAFGGFA